MTDRCMHDWSHNCIGLIKLAYILIRSVNQVLVDIFGEQVVGRRLYSDAKLVGLQPSTKKYKDVAPVTMVADDAKESSDPYPTIKPNGLRSLDYIDTVHEINGKLKLLPSYPVDLSEIDKKFGEPKPVEAGVDKENEPVQKIKSELPSIPSEELKEELSKVRMINGILLDFY